MGGLGIAGLALLSLSESISPAYANWFTRLIREAGETGSGIARKGSRTLDNAAAHVKSLPDQADGLALAAHATPEGHWKFVNRQGEVYTAGTPDEMKRAASILAPDRPDVSPERLSLYLTEETVFDQRALLETLPAEARLYVVAATESYALVRTGTGERLYAAVRPNLMADLDSRPRFREALWQLSRPLDRAGIRVLALEPGTGEALSPLPRYDRATRTALVDKVDPVALPAALASLSGQTVLVTGRIADGHLHFRPASGPERSVPLQDLTRAAEGADVNLVVLQSASPRQPGGRNWLWLKVEVSGLDEALKRATVADFLNALATGRGRLVVRVAREDTDRIVLSATPSGAASVEPGGGISGWFIEALSNVTGSVVTNGVEAYMRSAERQRELDRRIVPHVPSALQFAYLACLVVGVMGLGTARQWWERVWPQEQREEYRSAVGYWAARVTRLAAFVLLFLPLVGIPAFIVSTTVQVWRLISLPFRLATRLFGRPLTNA